MGVSTRSVDDLVQPMGMSGISNSQVSRLCGEIDDKIRSFLDRPLEGDWPYLWLDATYVKVREAGRIVSVAVTVAVAVNDEGRREVLGMAIGASGSETFWTGFLRSLILRGEPLDDGLSEDLQVVHEIPALRPVENCARPADRGQPMPHLPGKLGRAFRADKLKSKQPPGRALARADFDQQLGESLRPESLQAPGVESFLRCHIAAGLHCCLDAHDLDPSFQIAQWGRLSSGGSGRRSP